MPNGWTKISFAFVSMNNSLTPINWWDWQGIECSVDTNFVVTCKSYKSDGAEPIANKLYLSGIANYIIFGY